MLSMNRSAKVEHVAEAIYNASEWAGYCTESGLARLKWSAIKDDGREPFRELARAAIAAIKDAESEGEHADS